MSKFMYIENAVHMICWTALAIYFHIWWIALFAVLLVKNTEIRRNLRRNKDG